MKYVGYIATIVSFISWNLSYGQQIDNWCGTDYLYQQYVQEHPEEAAKWDKKQAKIFEGAANGTNEKSGTVYTIPVVVHVLHDNGIGNISKEQVEDGIRVLNEDFRRLNSDTNSTRAVFQPYAADSEFEFKLAKIDPNGNCTEGIVRINTTETYDAFNNVKGLSYWNSSKYLNVWLVETIENFNGSSGVILGYAQFPGAGPWNTYGLVMRNDTWGTIGTSNADGRTATHEVGHCLGLAHTFQSSCGNNCSSSGDRICDTPPAFQATYGCSGNQNTCSNDASGANSPYTTNVVDQIENYMSYDNCQNMFTEMQRDVMKDEIVFFTTLSNLVSSSNLVATGTNPGYVDQLCAPIAVLSNDKELLCENASVTFTDMSYNGTVANRTWNFPGGTPSTSNDSVVTVQYAAAGTYSVTLNVSNASGSDAATVNDIVEILPVQAEKDNWFYQESFEDAQEISDYWTVNNISGGQTWIRTTDAAYTGDYSFYFNNYATPVGDRVDEFITPSYDLDGVFEPRMTFKAAYARRTSTSNDLLRVYASVDCGETWLLRFARTSITLETVSGLVSGPFVPADQSEWAEYEVPLTSTIANSENVRFRFEFTSGIGNNIYIDDINIENPTGVETLDALNQSAILIPNPTNGQDQTIIQYDLLTSQEVTINLYNITGELNQVVLNSSNQSAGLQQVTIPTGLLSKGMYLVAVNTASGSVVKKLMVD